MPVVPLTPVAKATLRVVTAMEQRNDTIRQAHERGATIAAIAAASGLSTARIHQIIHHR